MKKGNKVASLPSKETNVIELLHADHQKVRDLFFKFKQADRKPEKNRLVKEILTELHVHATIEEEIVYPVVTKKADAADLIEEAETEHHVVKFLMAELSDMTASEDKFDAKVLVLCELVDHHVREEEKEMFEKLNESGADLNALGKKVMARKEELMALPLPAMKSSLSIKAAKTKTRKSA